LKYNQLNNCMKKLIAIVFFSTLIVVPLSNINAVEVIDDVIIEIGEDKLEVAGNANAASSQNSEVDEIDVVEPIPGTNSDESLSSTSNTNQSDTVSTPTGDFIWFLIIAVIVIVGWLLLRRMGRQK